MPLPLPTTTTSSPGSVQRSRTGDERRPAERAAAGCEGDTRGSSCCSKTQS
jgi:hypothetical protein